MINFTRKEEVDICIEWLKKQEQTKTVNRNHTSYGYKHIVENYYKTYISNDSFKEAVRILGIKNTPVSFSPSNIYVALSEKTVKKYI